jgi:hypothetical protein
MPSYINIQNDLSAAITAATTVNPALNSSYWGIDSNVAIGGQETRMLWMDRNEGITDGKTWIFTTAFTYAGVAIQLMEQLTGTFASSDIKIQITAGGSSTGWAEDDTTLNFTGNDNNLYQINGTYVSDGTYNDVTYTLLDLS